jgi:histidinol-phosphate aminotransferase
MAKTSRRDFFTTAAGAAILSVLEPRAEARSGSSLNIDWGYPEGAIRVGQNESPLGVSPKAARAMAEAIVHGNRYPKPKTLAERIAKLHGVDPEWLVFAPGSGDILKGIPRAFAQDGEVVTAKESYRDLPAEAERMKLVLHMVPLDRNFRHDLNAMANAIHSKTRVVSVTNPNNPSGTVLPAADLRNFADAVPKDAVYVIDEAYIHFTPEADVSSLAKEKKNVLVLRTFSKIYGLAGMRIGYALGHPDLMKVLRPFAARYVNPVGYAGALAVLDDVEYQERYRMLVREGKDFYQRKLAEIGAEYVPSETPFFLLNTREDGEEVEKRLQEHKIFVRRGKDWDMPTYIRISYGTREENKAVLSALKKTLKPAA